MTQDLPELLGQVRRHGASSSVKVSIAGFGPDFLRREEVDELHQAG